MATTYWGRHETVKQDAVDTPVQRQVPGRSKAALTAIKRENIRQESYIKLAKKAEERGIVTYSDLIVGLTGESHDSFLDGLDELMAAGGRYRTMFELQASRFDEEMDAIA